jgi:membrane associated rhomboid family serine protease
MTPPDTVLSITSRPAGRWRQYLLSREYLLGGWSPQQLGGCYGTLALSAMIVAAGVMESLIGWTPMLRAIGFVPYAAWSPATWFSILPGQALPVVLTWLTYVFPHMGWAHLASNVLCLLVFGGIVERVIGTRRFVAVSLLSSVSGVFALAAIHPRGETPIGGSSLLLCTLIGIWLAMYYRTARRQHARARLAIEIASVTALTLWLIFRTIPMVSSPVLALMWHVMPLMFGWFGYRLAAAFQTQLSGRCAEMER